MTGSPQQPAFFLWIDVMRGVAALAIVIFHYHHFYLADWTQRPSLPTVSEFPYASVFALFYEYGHYAVQFFWVISGFVFAHVYGTAQTVSGQAFWIARVARLYPLHLATLLFMFGLQMISLSLVGHWQIYGNNDLKHLVLQLFFASNSVTFSHGLSFNGPIWSVSLEICAYALFFVLLPAVRRFNVIVPSLVCIITYLIGESAEFDLPVIRKEVFICIAFFFAGVVLYRSYQDLARSPAVVASFGLMLLVFGVLRFDWEPKFVMLAITCCGLILFLAALDSWAPKLARVLKPLGDMSYSLYLVHVPIQATVLLCADLWFDGTRSFAESYWLLPVYVFASVALAHIVHIKFERPAGKAIRRRWMT